MRLGLLLGWIPAKGLELAMPVTAKFSEKFYQTLGHSVVDELVDWYN